MDGFTCTIEADPSPESIAVLEQGLDEYDRVEAGPITYTPLTILGRADDGTVVGGLRGTLGGGWLFVLTLWVSPDHRRRGLGSALLKKAEKEALSQDLPRVFLNTLSYQAPCFYERNGYTTFAVLEDAPAPHSRIFYRKDLV